MGTLFVLTKRVDVYLTASFKKLYNLFENNIGHIPCLFYPHIIMNDNFFIHCLFFCETVFIQELPYLCLLCLGKCEKVSL